VSVRMYTCTYTPLKAELYVINCVFHLMYHVFYGVSMCNICNNDGVHDILERSMLPSEHNLAVLYKTKLLTAA
jgi:hypothetical protein